MEKSSRTVVTFGLLLCILLLSGCMPSTIAELQKNGARESFSTSEGYQQVYRDISHRLHKCISGGFLLSENHIDENLYPNLKSGELTVRNNNMGDKSVLLHVEIRQGKTRTSVAVYSADVGIWADYPDKIKGWVVRGEQGCQ